MKKYLIGLAMLLVVVFGGCRSQTCIVTSTISGLGIDASFDPHTQVPHGRIGYIRSEAAIVPTNRKADGDTGGSVGGGAKDAPNVLLEMNTGGIFNLFTDSLIYQRLAIGETAVSQPGAVAMFLKNKDGAVDEKAVEAAKALSGLVESNSDKLKVKRDILNLTADEKINAKLVEELKKLNMDLDKFIDEQSMTEKELKELLDRVRN
ncbi:MAG TPA: hypothetical protein PLA71_00755 [Saccharofermentans sp.]|nr:hypothetical protein [Saccharofermentans sp.]